MERTNREVHNVQNPSLGAVIIWNFVQGYYKEKQTPAPFPLLFIVLPMIFKRDLCIIIKGTQVSKGLLKVSEKLFQTKMLDQLYATHDLADKQKDLTLESIRVGVQAGLLSVDYETALVYPHKPTIKQPSDSDIDIFLKSALKLGRWCSELSIHEVCTLLKVRF